jgi:hypothetical protein
VRPNTSLEPTRYGSKPWPPPRAAHLDRYAHLTDMTEEVKEKAAELKARLDYCRAEDRHECTLIHYRMLWMISCQGFLLATYFALYQSGVTDNVKSLIIALICIVSARIAWIVRNAIEQAENIIDKVHTLEHQVFIEAKQNKELEKYFSGYDRGRQWGTGDKDFHQIISFRCQSEIPWGFVVIWVILFLASIGPKFT